MQDFKQVFWTWRDSCLYKGFKLNVLQNAWIHVKYSDFINEDLE